MSRAGRLYQHNVAGLQLVRQSVERGRTVGHRERFTGPGPHPPRAGQQRFRLRPHRDQAGQVGPGGEFADVLVPVPRDGTKLGHVAEDRERPPVLRQMAESRQGSPDRLGVRVVRVVDDRHPISPSVDLHPPPAARHRRGKPVRDAGQAQAELVREGRGGQGVRHDMGAMQPQGYRGRALGGQQGEARPPELVQPNVRRLDRGLGHVRGKGRAGRHAEGDDTGRGPGGHGQDARVVGVQDGHALSGERLDELALGPGHLVQAAELPGVRVTYVQHHAVAGRRDAAQVGNVAGPPGRQLEDQVPGRGVRPQHGEGVAELVVERSGGRDRRPEALNQLGGHILGRRLARRAGDARDRDGGQRVQHESGQRGQGGRDVSDQDRGDRNRAGGQDRDRAGRDRGRGEVVPVGPLPRDRGEQAARPGPPGVDHHLPGHDGGRLPVQLAAGDLGDLG